jgi:hypothetical protein
MNAVETGYFKWYKEIGAHAAITSNDMMIPVCAENLDSGIW